MVCVYFLLNCNYFWLSLLSATYFGSQSPNNVPFPKINLRYFQGWKCGYFQGLLTRKNIGIELEEQISQALFLSFTHTAYLYIEGCIYMQTHPDLYKRFRM